MKSRRILAALLALLIICLPIASAETTLVNSFTIDANYITLSRTANVMTGRDNKTGYYTLYAADGTALTTEPYLAMDNANGLYQVAVEEGLNNYGLIDITGKLVVPMQYGDVIGISDRWYMGVTLEEATVDNYDYKAWDGSAFYLVSGYDVYFDGAKVGTLSRTAYKNAYAHGAYLYVQDAESNYTYYDSAFAPSGYASDYPSSSEYEEVKNDVWHRGSNQKAFTAECTLTSDDVELDIYLVDGRFVDLQGNVLFAIDAKYDYVDKFKGDYVRVKMNGLYGLLDRTGREVMACEYDDIPYGDEFFEGDYQPAVKGGKFGYVNRNGEVTCDFVYAESAVKSIYRMPATTVADLTGSFIVLSGAVGELPEKYAEVSINSKNGSPLIVVENGSEQAGVIDLQGNVVIPMDGTYDDAYDLSVSTDGTLVVGYTGDRTYQIYNFSFGEQAAEESAAASGVNSVGRPAMKAGSAANEPAAEENADPNAWTCACGSVNTGKFCPECGTAKPAGCPGCGAAVAEGAKFCSECGAALTAAE